MFIHERDNWPDFRWDEKVVQLLLDKVCRELGLLYGRLMSLGFHDQLAAMADNLTNDVVTSSEIEGIRLNIDEVRSSVARRLSIENYAHVASSRYVDGVVNVALDAINNYQQPLTKERICGWHTAFFPLGYSQGIPIEVGRYRSNPEHIISGAFGREKVHYIAPAPERIPTEMERFLEWFNNPPAVSPVICSAIAHLWFVSIHPFEDGNGRMARIIADLMLARGDNSKFRFYNISSEINRHKKHYYSLLEQTQRGDGDITDWLVWYMHTLIAAIENSVMSVVSILNKSVFWQRASTVSLTQRQIKVLNIFLDGYEANLTSKIWAKLAECSKDTAIRDLNDLLAKGIIREDVPGAKRPVYSLILCDSCADVADKFAVKPGDGYYYLCGELATVSVRQRVTDLEATRVLAGELPLPHLIEKYCAYLLQS